MTKASYAKAITQALTPFGFKRSGSNWVRIRGDMWECVNLQRSQFAPELTVNLVQKDLETERLYLEIFGPDGAIQMQPQSDRIGQLIDGYDRWWEIDQPDGPEQLADAVVKYGLPRFDRVRTLAEQAEYWYHRPTLLGSSGYPSRLMEHLALTLYRMGETEEACAVLRKRVTKTANSYHVDQVAKMRAWLGCAPSP